MKWASKKIFILSLSSITILSSVGRVNALEIKMNSNLNKQIEKRTTIPALDTLTMVQAFPDANFRAYLCDILSIKDENALISKDSKDKIEVIDNLGLYEKSIKDLSGVNYFVNLKRLYCSNNNLEILDVSNNPELEILSCNNNNLKTLDVSNNLELKDLSCYRNNLETLDVSNNLKLRDLHFGGNNIKTLDISKNKKLEILYCYDNSLKTLDVSNNPELTHLSCFGNNLETLDVSNNPELKELYCDGNDLKTLDVSKNKKLETLYCYDNNLKTLDVSNNLELTYLCCDGNELKILDVSNNPELKELRCYSNNLKTLDVSNNLELAYLDCSDNMLKTLDVSRNKKLIYFYWENQRKESSGGNSYTPVPIVTKTNYLVGSDRYDTSVKISKEGWDNVDNVVLINSSSISDALSATPFAKAKNAPILLTQNNNLNQLTENEINRLGAKNIYIIGGFNSVDASIEKYLKDKGLNIIRISGNDRYDTSIKLAKELNKENKLSKLVLVNGEKGLVDAVSMGAVSAKEKMPILLTNETDDMKAIEELIDNKDISKSYVVGGDSLFNKDIGDKLPYVIRISGEDRVETNAKVIDYFYDNNVLNNLYIAKNGENREDDLVDALSVGVLAGKTESPVLLVGDGISDTQKSLINKREFRNITQIGGNGNEKAFSEVENLVK
ncbi:TPA: cell wall-binding repeat-containing protein [Clostridioides difficile]|nr:cell wall-binding repeat-containing protein [Clostridioides difficile]HEK9030779.1 cell wall-binding repeat-containing protein [Clostridioides difficile]